MNSTPNQLETETLRELELNQKQLALLQEQVKHRRRIQKRWALMLYDFSNIPLVTIARTAGVNRMTLHRWVKEVRPDPWPKSLSEGLADE